MNTQLNPAWITDKVNELFHFQKNKNWQSMSEELIALYSELSYRKGKVDAIESLIGTIDYETDKILERRHEKFCKLADETIDKIDNLIKSL